MSAIRTTPQPDERPPCLRDPDGRLAVHGRSWLEPADAVERAALAQVLGPVLDVGCGPGRHLLALAARGVDCLGIDLTPAMVRLARAQGAPAVVGSVFGNVPRAGNWASALLMDGNIGIGGDPVALLRRMTTLLRPDGMILAELASPGPAARTRRVRVEGHLARGPWFDWAHVGADSAPVLAAGARLSAPRLWTTGGRWFALLRR